MKLLPLILLSLMGLSSLAQEEYQWKKSDEKLAVQFYQEGEYAKARPLLEDLVKDGKDHLSDYYFDCLVQLNDFKEAEKFVKKRIKRSDVPSVTRVDLVYVYGLSGEGKQKEKEIDFILEHLPVDEIGVAAVAGAFERREMEEQAMETYLAGRKRLNGAFLFAKPLAELYSKQGEMAKMADEYISFLKVTPTGGDVVKTAFATHIEKDASYEIIKNSLIKEIQANPGIPQLVDVLSWTFVSKKEFYSAFIQLKALDKRLREGGKRLNELAKVCRTNKEFATAEKCYAYILEQGQGLPYFYQAKLGIIDTKYERITLGSEQSKEDFLAVEADFVKFTNERAIPANERWKAYIRLAEIRAVYLGKYAEAIKGLEEIENSPRIDLNTRGRIKIDLGNYYMLSGDIWEASLKYSQVEKLFKDHPLGHESKYLNAKLSFYRGEFEWAKAQLDVLKGSTSELIANDALQLALLIQDNLALDTITTPLELYATADKFIFMQRYDDANLVLDTIMEFFPGHTLRDEILMAKGNIAVKKKDFEKALEFYRDVYTSHSTDILADDALYAAANVLEFTLKKEEEALKLLDVLVFNYLDSIYGVDAKKRYRALVEKYPSSKQEEFFNEGLEKNENP